MIEPKESDTLFKDSPDTGHKECKCSRCGNVIPEGDMPIRVWPQEKSQLPERYQKDGHPAQGWEYRYCEECSAKAGLILGPK